MSVSTISRALNNHESIDSETRARARQTADRLGYKPPRADGRRNQEKVLAVLMQRSGDNASVAAPVNRYGTFNHIQSMLFSIEQTAEAYGYHLILNSLPSVPDELPSSIRTGFADGALLLGGLVEDSVVERIAQEVPTIFVSSSLPSGTVHAIHINYRQGAVHAVNHLVELGHQHIGLLNGPQTTNTSGEKLAGYLQACWNHHLPLDRALVVDALGFEFGNGIEAARQLFGQAQCTAIVTATDLLAHAAIHVAQTRGLRLPDDLSVVSLYDSHDASGQHEASALTGVRVPYEYIGQVAVERLLTLIASPEPPRATVLFPQFEVGTSSGPAPKR